MKRKKVVWLFVILFSMVLAIPVWNNRYSFSPAMVIDWSKDGVCRIGKGLGFPYDITGKHVNKSNFKPMGKDLAVVTDTSFIVLNNTAKEVANRQHSFFSPVLKIGGDNALIYDLYGTGYRIERRSRTVLDGNTDDSIIAADIASNGIQAFVTHAKGYRCALTVLSADGTKQIYKYYFSECNINDVVVSGFARKVIAIGHTIDGPSIKSVAYVFDYNEEDPVARFEYKDNTMFAVRFLPTGKAVLIGSNLLSVIGSKKSVEYDYKGRILRGFSVDKGIVLALSTSDKGDACSVVVLNVDGKVKSELKTDDEITDISFHNDTIVWMSNNKMAICEAPWTSYRWIDVDADTKKTLLCDNSTAFLLGVSSIKKVKL